MAAQGGGEVTSPSATPFLNLRREIYPGEIHVVASKVAWIEISLSRTTAQLVIGLESGKTIESHVFEPTDQTITRLRELRDEILDDLIVRLQAEDDRPKYAPLPPAGA